MAEVGRRNNDYPWDEFDPNEYLRRNYAEVREGDRLALAFVGEFFINAFAEEPVRAGRRGIDVGTGTNLYPALTMLPFCDQLILYEHSRANVDWLSSQRDGCWSTWPRIWERFWQVLHERKEYAELAGNPRPELAKRAPVVEGSVFALGDTGEQWDVGTMFFVAESITALRTEFIAAINHFLDALRPGEPFAIAFMEHSTGYQVAHNRFPATSIDRRDVQECLGRRAVDIAIHRTGVGENPLREGYSGMITACGRVAADARRSPGPGGSEAVRRGSAP